MDAGESAAEACAREVLEETGLVVRVDRLIGVYSDPNLIIEYPGGNRVQPLSLNFAAVAVGGELTITAETTEVGYFSQKAMKSLEIWDHHVERIADAFAGCSTTFVR
jgi:ADP-ribose pyrophosphatase YjhB (NUDIX family)